ncbi:MAG: serine hydrolase, partial [Acidobacteria bacterium]|nr:serine hydrolase [Acidobacteriota bacterium]
MKAVRFAPVIEVMMLVLVALAMKVPGEAQTTGRRRLELTPAKPETVGFSSERLERLHTLIEDEVKEKHLAGAITILARHGKVVDYRTYGQRDLASGAPMTKDVIFRDYSMTKPVTGVA